MFVLAVVATTCWVCTIIAIPRRPAFGNEVEDLVYRRLLGRQHRLLPLALVASLLTCAVVILHLPGTASAEIAAVSEEQAVCNTTGTGPGVCWVGRPGGMWVVERQQPDGRIVIEDYVTGQEPNGR